MDVPVAPRYGKVPAADIKNHGAIRMSKRRPIVFVANRSYHDYTRAEEFGDLRFLTEGQINKLSIGQIYRQMEERLADSTHEDFFMPTSLPILAGVATGILVAKHGMVRYLLFQYGQYSERLLDLRKFSTCEWRD
jgi:hypothetical protein